MLLWLMNLGFAGGGAAEAALTGKLIRVTLTAETRITT